MAITTNVVNAADTGGSNATELTVNVTLAAGANRLVLYLGSGNGTSATGHNNTGSVFGGVAWDAKVRDTAPSTSFHQQLMLAKVIGSHGSGEGSTAALNTWVEPDKLAAVCLVLNGVDQVTPIDTAGLQARQSAFDGDTATQLTVASAPGNMVYSVIPYVKTTQLDPPTFESGETPEYHHWDEDGFYGIIVSVKAGAASTVVGIPSLASTRFSHFAFEVNAAATGGVMRSTSAIGTGGMQTLNGGMQGRAYARAQIVAPIQLRTRDLQRLGARHELRV